jgi:hypothetical protein
MVLHHHEGPSTLLIRNANVNALLVLDILITHSPVFEVQVGGRGQRSSRKEISSMGLQGQMHMQRAYRLLRGGGAAPAAAVVSKIKER